jgi:hypothetical protein
MGGYLSFGQALGWRVSASEGRFVGPGNYTRPWRGVKPAVMERVRLAGMPRVLVLTAALCLIGASAAEGKLVGSSVDSGSLPTPSLLVYIKNPKPPRIDVKAQPGERIEIDTTVSCNRGAHRRSKDRTIRTKPPFSGRMALAMSNPDLCGFFVIAQYDDETSDNEDEVFKRGTIKLRIYR